MARRSVVRQRTQGGQLALTSSSTLRDRGRRLEAILNRSVLEAQTRLSIPVPADRIALSDPQRALQWLFPLYTYLEQLLQRFWRYSLGLAHFQIETDTLVIPEPIESWWRQVMLRLITGLAQRLHAQVADALREGIEAGESELQIAARLQPILQSYRSWQLYRIVRTESLRAYNLAQITHTAAIPEVVAWRYSVILDDRTSAICRQLAGKVVTRAQLRLVPPLHPHCRTILVPILQGDEDLERLTPESIAELQRDTLGVPTTPLPEPLWHLIRSGQIR